LAGGSTMFYGTVGIAAADSTIDFSVVSLFDSIRVEAGAGGGSNVLELVDDPGVFFAMLSQYTWNQSDIIINNAKLGSAKAYESATGTGELNKGGETITAGNTLDFVIDLSQFMGLFTQHLPLYGTNGINLVLHCAPQGSGVVTAGNTAAVTTITLPYVMATILEGGEKYEKALQSMKSSNGEVSVMFNTYTRYVQNTTGGTNTQLVISDNAKSCLGFFAVSRLPADIVLPAAYKNGNSGFTSWLNHAVSVGGVLYPQNPIATKRESYEEALDLMRVISRKPTNSGIISKGQGFPAVAYTNGATGPSTILAVNLTKCPTDNWGAGLNTSGVQNLQFQVSYTPTTGATVTIFALRQQKVHIDAMGNFSVER